MHPQTNADALVMSADALVNADALHHQRLTRTLMPVSGPAGSARGSVGSLSRSVPGPIRASLGPSRCGSVTQSKTATPNSCESIMRHADPAALGGPRRQLRQSTGRAAGTRTCRARAGSAQVMALGGPAQHISSPVGPPWGRPRACSSCIIRACPSNPARSMRSPPPAAPACARTAARSSEKG